MVHALIVTPFTNVIAQFVLDKPLGMIVYVPAGVPALYGTTTFEAFFDRKDQTTTEISGLPSPAINEL